MPVKRTKKATTSAFRKEDDALAILKPIFKKVGWTPVIGCDLCFMSMRTSKNYIALFHDWSDAFSKANPRPNRAHYKDDQGKIDQESYRRDSSEWNANLQRWFSSQLSVIINELKSVCSENRWRFRTAGTQLRINL